MSPSLIDVFGDDSQISPLPHVGYNQDQTIEADLGSFDEPSFVSVDSNTSISDFDSRSRYHTTELRRDSSAIEVRESLERTSDYDVMPDVERPVSKDRGSNISGVSSHTVGNYPAQPKEKKGFRYGFYVVLLLLIAVLGMQVMEKSSLTSDESTAQGATRTPSKPSDSSARNTASMKTVQAPAAADEPKPKGVKPSERRPDAPENTAEGVDRKTDETTRSKASTLKTVAPPAQPPKIETRLPDPKPVVRKPTPDSRVTPATQVRPSSVKNTQRVSKKTRPKPRSKPSVRRARYAQVSNVSAGVAQARR